jgi:phosphohistidine phosphatase SixA
MMQMRLLLAVFSVTAVSISNQEPAGARGIEATRRGGVVVVCRHGITDPAEEDEQTLRYDDPATQRRLSAAGERQAGDMGTAFRALRIRAVQLIASPMQRATRTAELAFGQVQRDSAWHTRGEYYGGWKHDRRAQALGDPVTGGVRVIVSHAGTMYSMLPSLRGALQVGDCVVVRPQGASRYEVIEVVPWRSWGEAAARIQQ